MINELLTDDILGTSILQRLKSSRIVCKRWRNVYDASQYHVSLEYKPYNLLTPADFWIISKCEFHCKFILSEDFMWKFTSRLDMILLTIHQKMSARFLFAKAQSFSKFAWKKVCFYQKLPENFLRAFSNRLDWFVISAKQVLSAKFIEDFGDRLYLQYVITKNEFGNPCQFNAHGMR